MWRFRIQALYIVETAMKSLRGHERILEAVEKGDPKSAVAALEEHLKSAKDDILHHDMANRCVKASPELSCKDCMKVRMRDLRCNSSEVAS